MTFFLLSEFSPEQPTNQAGEWCSEKLLESSTRWRCNPLGWEENVNGHHKVITGESNENWETSTNCSNLFFKKSESTDGSGASWCQEIVHGLHALLRWRHLLKLALSSVVQPFHRVSSNQANPYLHHFKLYLSKAACCSPLLMHFFIPLKRLPIDWWGESNLNIYIRGTLNVCLGLLNWCSLQKKPCSVFHLEKSLSQSTLAVCR